MIDIVVYYTLIYRKIFGNTGDKKFLTGYFFYYIMNLDKEGFHMANVFDVAKYILSEVGEVSTMKLQKLCYYSYVKALLDKHPLFTNSFEAWANGPVCRDLFKIHKGQFSIVASQIPNNLLSNTLTPTEKFYINATIEKYGKLTGTELSEMTHRERPWIEARDGISPSSNSAKRITRQSILDFYHNAV